MEVHLKQAGKSFEGRSILKGIDLSIEAGSRTLIGGPNGAGKSTLLKLVAAFLRPSSGTIEHRVNGESLDPDRVYPYVAIAAPYLRFPGDLTVSEIVRSWQRFRPLKRETYRIPDLVGLSRATDRPVRELSSGMEQRLKLAIAFSTDCPLLLLDEPLTNIDAGGRKLYHELLEEEGNERSILICSNDPEQEAAKGAEAFRIEEGIVKSC
jgi:ABC-type multidrug transport system ATPase subunit